MNSKQLAKSMSYESDPKFFVLSNKNPIRILVVEDDGCLIPLFERAVFDWADDAEISIAVSLEEAVTKFIRSADVLQTKPYDLIIADIFLEGAGTGLDLFKVIHGTFPKIPFLVTSSIPFAQVLANVPLQYIHNMSYLRKPFLFAQCKEQIGNLLIKK